MIFKVMFKNSSYSYEVPLNKGGLRRELSRTIQGGCVFTGLLYNPLAP